MFDIIYYFHNYRKMEKQTVIDALAALAQATRLDIFRLLVPLGEAGMPAGMLGEQLGIPNATLSFHLQQMRHAGLLMSQRKGTQIIYAANYPAMDGLIGYLTENCCQGEPCLANGGCNNPQPTGNRKMNVLFLCTGNSCRSILGEATFNHLAPAGWRAMSAGSKPTGQVHPRSLALLAREGISTEGYYSKSWENLPATPDIVISVCGNAANETCPAYLGPVLRTHWGVEDPAHATGTDAEIDTAFMQAYRILRARIEAFFALPLQVLQHDKAALKAEMDKIATIVV